MKIYFVGAGPGDPELLTVKALRLVATCKVCIYAGSLVSPAVLAKIAPEAEKHDSASLSHPEVIALFQDAQKRGLDVVRLHTGDPSIYGAIGEQISDLEKLGIAYEVVPGVSAFQASAAALGWELTVPEVAQSIVLTRTPGRTPMPEAEALENFAKTGATLCVFLSAHAIAEHAPLLAKYYGKDCPAAVVFHASWADQKIVQGTLADIAEKIRAEGIEKTALFIVRRASTGAQSRLYAPEFAHGYRQVKDGVQEQEATVKETPVLYEGAPTCHIVAGPNGSGKSTFAIQYLPRYAGCCEFVNPDLIALGLSPFNPQHVALKAGKLVLERMGELSKQRVDFAFETTLSGMGYINHLQHLKAQGYRLELYYLWSPSTELLISRIRQRVQSGGHYVPDADVVRRYNRSLAQLSHYLPMVDVFHLFDNSGSDFVLVYEQNEIVLVHDEERFTIMRKELGL
jgi:precorrin-4/cobalt-precorrin-4 C11-methyltransferase